MSLNNVVLMGRLTADPENRTTNSGVSVTPFTLAVERSYKANGERVADFVDCVAWRGAAEFLCKYFRKGSMVAITGEINTRMFEDKSGNKRKATEVTVHTVDFTGEKRDSQPAANTGAANTGTAYNDFEEIVGDDDLPF